MLVLLVLVLDWGKTPSRAPKQRQTNDGPGLPISAFDVFFSFPMATFLQKRFIEHLLGSRPSSKGWRYREKVTGEALL